MSGELKLMTGENGGILISDTNAHTGKWFAIQVISDAVISAITTNISGTLTGVTFTAGTVVYGRHTAITLTSGSVICYEV